MRWLARLLLLRILPRRLVPILTLWEVMQLLRRRRRERALERPGPATRRPSPR